MNATKSGDNFQPMLKESIDRFLCEFRKGAKDFSNFSSIFSRLLQNLPDPSLEYVWFYSALDFYTTKFTAFNSLNEVLATKDLFQLLVSCSSSCNVVKKVAVLAPVIYELYYLLLDKKYLKGEVENLLEGIVSYIFIFCGSESDQDDRMVDLSLNHCFADMVRVWAVDKIGENCDLGETLRVFLPIIGDKVRNGVGLGCQVGYFAGVVMCEAFLLRLCLKFGLGISRDELDKDLYDCAVQMITGFRNYYFLDNLYRMLLEPFLPITSLLGSEDEIHLHKILCDAVVTVEYSFLTAQRVIHLPCKNLKNLAVRWLFVVDNVLQTARENGDQAKFISYVKAFSESCLLSELIKWVTHQTGIGGRISTPDTSTPVALIKWLLIVEDQGVRVFDCDISRIYARAMICKSRLECEHPAVLPNGKNLNENRFFYTNNEEREHDKVDGDLEMVDSIDTEFLAASCFMKSTVVRKRKEGRQIEGEIPVKFAKYDPHVNSAIDKFSLLGNDDGLSSGSEVDNPASDEDMEDLKQ